MLFVDTTPAPIAHAVETHEVTPQLENPPITDSDEHLDVLDSEAKLTVIREWQALMSTDKLRMVVCAVCSKRICESESTWVDGDSVDFSLLTNELLPDKLAPRSYDRIAYGNALLNPKGLESTKILSRIRMCLACKKSISNGSTPKFALANWLYYGHDLLPDDVKDCFTRSSLFEKKLICRARCNSITCRFDSRGVGNVAEGGHSLLNNERKGIRGNVMVAPLDVVRMNEVIPPASNYIRDTICAIFVGDTVPTRSTIARYQPVLVRKSRVKNMIMFLLSNNPHYMPSESFGFSEANLNTLFEGVDSACIPTAVDIGYIASNGAIESATSDYTQRNVDHESDVNVEHEELLMENVGYTEGDDSPLSYHTMKATALERCLQGKPFLVSGKGSQYIPDFNNPSVMTWLFPHLDPWGIGGFFHPLRRIKLSMEEQLAHLLMVDDSPFERDPEFAFVFYNVCRKALVSQSLRFIVSRHQQRSIVEGLLTVQPELLRKIQDECQKNPQYKPVEDEEKKIFRLLSSLRMIARHVPGSDGYKIMRRNEIRALIMYNSSPTLLITLNPSDVDNPIVRIFAGDEINLEDMARGEDLTEWQRKLFAARNPSACARFFDLMIRTFIHVILRYGRDGNGVYGKCVAYYGTVEAQGKGTLHCHMLVWLKGHLSPQSLRDKMFASEIYRDKVFRWLESVIKCEFPRYPSIQEQTFNYPKRVHHKETGDPHPGVICGPSASHPNFIESGFWLEYIEFLVRLLHQYSWHEHQATCWKYLEKGQARTDENCRLGMDGQLLETTYLDPLTHALVLRRHHARIANYTDIVTFLMQCNMDVKFVGSGDAAKAFLYYVTDYITKPTLSVHVGMAALSYAVKKASERIPEGLEGYSDKQGMGAVITAVNSMMGRQEISQPQVMSYLIGGGDHYKSHNFSVLNWGAIQKFVLTEWLKHSGAVSQSDGDAETVTLTLGVGTITASNQQLDYVYRSPNTPFTEMCLYDFVSLTSKVRYSNVGSSSKSHTEINGSFSGDDHPQYYTHYMRRRRQFVVPVLLGPSIVNPSKSDAMEEDWSRDMLILFKPWRNAIDLKAVDISWSNAFKSYRDSEMHAFHNMIIANMQVLTECHDARDRHPRGKKYIQALDHDADQMPIGYDASDGPLSENITSLMSACAAVPDHHDPFSRFENGCNDSAYISGAIISDSTSRILDSCLTVTMEDLTRIVGINKSDKIPSVVSNSEQQVVMEQRTLMVEKRKRKKHDIHEEGSIEGSSSNRVRAVSGPIALCMTLREPNIYSKFRRSSDIAKAEEIIEIMGLSNNREQLTAFTTIAKCAIDQSYDQLLMHVSGVGGTGKSHVIKAIVMLFERLGRRDELLLGAPTGIAAVMIGGQTMHSLILASPNGKPKDIKARLVMIWKHVNFLIVDEVSMVGAQFLSLVSSRMRQGKGDDLFNCDKAFGGVNVIFMGDFAQLSPPGQQSVYSYRLIKDLSFAQSTYESGISAVNGVFLWRQVKLIVELVRNQRHAEDPIYSRFLSRLRLGECIPHWQSESGVTDLEYINSHLVENLATDPAVLASFRDAPIIVGTKALRDALNTKLVEYHARRSRRELEIYYAVDTISRKTVTGRIQKRLWNLPSTANNDALGRLPLFIGMRVMITENLAFDNCIVNGTEGFVYDIKYSEDDKGRRYAVVVYVHIAGCGFTIDGLPEDVVPIFPVSTHITHSPLLSTEVNNKSFTRKQLPLVPAYVFTDFKGQGRTVTRLIADLATAKGQGPYVMLSRVKTLDGLMILRWFPPTKIYHTLSNELSDELSRLRELCVSNMPTVPFENSTM